MRRILPFVMSLIACVGVADAAVRDGQSVNRAATTTTVVRTATPNVTSARTTAPTVTSRGDAGVVSRAASNTNARNAATARAATTISRAASNTTARGAAPIANTSRTARAATNTTARTAATRSIVRAATQSVGAAGALGIGYNTCRDAYFSCMDQFCAKQNEHYRRCICSARLDDIKSRERTIAQTDQQLQDFISLNIEAIPKTAAEVKAMLRATDGEAAYSTTNDTSNAAQMLSGISAVLTATKSKSKATSTQGTLDIAGDINAIWATTDTDLTAGADIATLSGAALYNAVHEQCAEMVSASCDGQNTLNMVIAAYGMYIENDCATLSKSLDKQETTANANIRETGRQMGDARLDNYNAHNSTEIGECIANVRRDITADTACGADYVHCLDISGKYLNRTTGEPIYTADFYQLGNQLSLSGDILTNAANRLIVAELNRKREFVKNDLEMCRNVADDVWDEFLRQAITEIYQGQQERIRQVKFDCLDVVNTCYDAQSKSLKDFSNIKNQLLLGSRLELAETMCAEKLTACSNLYGGGPDGLDLLVNAMRDITDQKIGMECRVTLQEYARDLCAVPSNDTLHSYPFGCRVYAPGDPTYAAIKECNNVSLGGTGNTGTFTTYDASQYSCPKVTRFYRKCLPGAYMAVIENDIQTCLPCEPGYICNGGSSVADSAPIAKNTNCGTEYPGSLYQKMVQYALQACVRPSKSDDTIPVTILQDVNVVMDSIRISMATELASECDRLGGTWVDSPWVDDNNTDGAHDITGQRQYSRFYTQTSANTKWGFCAEIATQSDTPQTETETN